MTKTIAALLLTLMIFAVMPAQAAGLKATVPFPFYAGSTLMPAGSYAIQRLNGFVLTIRNIDTEQEFMVQSLTNTLHRPPEDAKLVFNRYGTQYFLAEAWWAGDSNGRVMSRSKREIELAKNMKPTRIESTIARAR